MLRKLQALDRCERRLLVVGLGWVLAARVTLVGTGGSLPRTERALDALGARLPPLTSTTTSAAVWAITAAARRVPGTRCLAWALAVRALLHQAGIPANLRIGVARAEPMQLKAHAWVECGGLELSWGDAVNGYRVLHRTAVVP
jgi:hypothetical protein